MRSHLLILVSVVPAACGSDVTPGSLDGPARVVVDTVADTIGVLTQSGSEWGSRELVENLRIGRADGEDHEMFGRIDAIAVIAGGDMLVYDGQANILRRYAPDGRFVGMVGREGSGPGEFRVIAGITPLADGRFAVYDFGNRRVNVHNAAGDPAATWLVRAEVAERRPLHPQQNGGIFLHDELESGRDIIVRVDSDGRMGDTMVIPRSEYRRIGLARRIGTRSVGTVLPFSAEHYWSVTATGDLVTAIGDRYAIDVRRADGSVLRLMRAAPPVPVTPEERAAEEARVASVFQRYIPDWSWDGPPIPESKPPVSWVHTGADGTIWVRVAQPGTVIPEAERGRNARSFVQEPQVFDVYESGGTFLGQARAPDNMLLLPFPVLSRESVLAVARGTNGVHVVIRYRFSDQTS